MNPGTQQDSPPNFDRLARPYRWMEYLTFGPFLHRARTHFLSELKTRRRALILGDGDGRFTAALLRINSAIRVQAIDASPAMLHSLHHRAHPHTARLTTHKADLRTWQPPSEASYDLIATHFFLDCLSTDQVAALAQRIRQTTAPGTLWVLSEFAIPASGIQRVLATGITWALYHAFGLLTGLKPRRLPDHQAALTAAGFILQASHKHLAGLLISELWTIPQPASSAGKTPAT